MSNLLITHGQIFTLGAPERADRRRQCGLPGSICGHTHFYGAFARGMAIPGAPTSSPQRLATREFAGKVRGDCTLKVWDGFYHETHNEPEKAKVLAFMVDWLQEHALSQ